METTSTQASSATTAVPRAGAAAALSLCLGACASLSPYPAPFDAEPGPETIALSDGVYQFLAGDLSLRYGNVEEALAHYGEVLARSPDPALFRAALSIAVQNELYPQAAQLAERWRRLVPENLQLNKTLFLIHLKLEDYEAALSYLELIIGDDWAPAPDYSSLWPRNMGVEQSFQYAGALRDRFAQNAKVHLLYAFVAFRHGRYQESVDSAARVLSLRPNFFAGHLIRADALFQLGRAREALLLLRRQVERHPRDRALLLKTAAAHWRHGHEYAAYELYQKAHRLYPDDPEVLQALGVLRLHRGEHRQARDLFNKLGTLEAERNRSAYYLGRVAEEEGDLPSALERYHVVTSGPFYNEARIAQARVHQRQGRVDLARAQLATARLRAQEPQARIALFIAEAEILAEARDKEAAFGVYTRALADYANSPNLLYSRAMLALSMDRFDVFEHDLKSIIERDPANWRALNALGYVLADRNQRLHEAREYIRRALALQPESAVILDSMGWVEFRLNNLAGARDFLQRAADKTRHPEIIGHLVEVLWLQGEKTRALEMLEQASSEFPDDEYLARLRRLHAR